MAKTLIVVGLGLIAAWVLLKVAAIMVEVSLYAGSLLILIGRIWWAFERSEKEA